MCKDLYEAASLKLVLKMRAGEDLTQVTKELCDNRHWWSDWMDEYTDHPSKRKWSYGSSAATPGQGKGAKSKTGPCMTAKGDPSLPLPTVMQHPPGAAINVIKTNAVSITHMQGTVG